MKSVEELRSFLVTRQQAFQQVFNEESLFVKAVMKDLARFCRANDSTFHQDPRVHAALEGRREVYLRILHHVNLTPDEFWEKYKGGNKNE